MDRRVFKNPIMLTRGKHKGKKKNQWGDSVSRKKKLLKTKKKMATQRGRIFVRKEREKKKKIERSRHILWPGQKGTPEKKKWGTTLTKRKRTPEPLVGKGSSGGVGIV